jgi:hypothetical protein
LTSKTSYVTVRYNKNLGVVNAKYKFTKRVV